MASKETSHKRPSGQACHHCRKIRRKCVDAASDSGTCVNCHETGVDCSLAGSRATLSTDAKSDIENTGSQLEDTYSSSGSFRVTRASSSTATLQNARAPPILPPPKNLQQNKRIHPTPVGRGLPPERRQKISSGICGICLKKEASSGEKKGDELWLKCDIQNCPRWYHLSCIQFKTKGHQIFQSQATGTKKCMFICQECFKPADSDLIKALQQAEWDFKRAIEQAQSDFKTARESILQAVTVKEGWPPQLSIPRPQDEQHISPVFEDDPLSPETDTASTTHFELTKTVAFQAFQENVIKFLLGNIEQAVYDYDREIVCANELFLDRNDDLKSTPMKVWEQVDPGRDLLSGKQWFEADGMANNLSEGHAPITAALRQMLRTPDDQPLQISPDLEDLSFSQVHQALINWFVFDLLNNELNMYDFPNLKPLKATLAAVANFGNARWKGNGLRVVREVQLRAWHKTQFREEVIEKVGWQGELIRRLEGFLTPLTRRIGKIDPRSESRAAIIKHAVELWSYLDAANGTLEIIQPFIGGPFNKRSCENVDEKVDAESQSRGNENMEVKWAMRRGFRFRERCTAGNAMLTKALVVVNKLD